MSEKCWLPIPSPGLLLSFKFLLIGGEEIFHCFNLHTLIDFQIYWSFINCSCCLFLYLTLFFIDCHTYWVHSFLIPCKYFYFLLCVLVSRVFDNWVLKFLFGNWRAERKLVLNYTNNGNEKYFIQNKKAHDKLGKTFVTWCS